MESVRKRLSEKWCAWTKNEEQADGWAEVSRAGGGGLGQARSTRDPLRCETEKRWAAKFHDIAPGRHQKFLF